MKCFVHRQSEAIGVCKSCSRALCQECVVEAPDGISCRGRCEQVVAGLNSMVERNISLSASAHRIWYVYAALMALIGASTLTMALAHEGAVSTVNLAVGGGLFAVALVLYRYGRKIKSTLRAA